jgi:hypothetical protein
MMQGIPPFETHQKSPQGSFQTPDMPICVLYHRFVCVAIQICVIVLFVDQNWDFSDDRN